MITKHVQKWIVSVCSVTVLLALMAGPGWGWIGGGHPNDTPGPPGCGPGGTGAGAGGGATGGAGGTGPGDHSNPHGNVGTSGGCGGELCATAGFGGSPQVTVNLFTGNLTIQDMPVTYQAVGSFVPFVVTFNSQSGQSGPLGDRWTHTYNVKVIDHGTDGAEVLEGNGWVRPYTGVSYQKPASVFVALEKTYSGQTWTGWRVTRPSHQKMQFDTTGKLTQIEDADGLTTSLTYSSGLLTTITDSMGRQTTLQYTNGLLTRVTVPGGLYATFGYDAYTPKRLTSITDAAGQTYSFGYSGTRVTSITDPSGREVWYQYGTFNSKTVLVAQGVTDNTDYNVTYDYASQANGQLYTDVTALKDGADRITRYIHEFTDDAANGRYYGALLSVIHDYGDSSHVNAQQAWAYNSDFRVVRYKDSYQKETDGKAHRHFYYYTDANFPEKVTKYIDPENSDANPTDTGTPSANCPGYLYEYDSLGNLTSERTPESTAQHPRGTDYTYVSGTNRLASVTIQDEDINGSSADHTTSYTYWGSAYGYQVKTVTDARSNVTTYYYDGNGYLDYIDPPLGNNTDYTCNSMGDVTAITDGNGNTTSYQYDGIHRQTQITYPDVGAGQKSKTFAWTCCGLDTVTDENGKITKHEYDQYTKHLWKVHEDYTGLNYVTEYAYDEVGNLKTVKNARSKTTTHFYDGADRLIHTDYPDSTHESWSYRDDGRVLTHTDGRARVTTYRYDADDQLAGSGSYKAVDYPTDADVKITRDKDGLMTQVEDASGTSTMAYYPSTWVKTVTNGASKTVTYQYSGVGDVSTMTTPGSLDFTYSYNARNQLASVSNPNSVTVSFTYDNGGRRTRVDRPGGYTLYEYNARDWVYYVRNRDSSNATKYQVKYFWDDVGNVTQKAEWFEGVPNYYWTYFSLDGVYRLTREARRHRDSSTYDYDYRYGYDAVGNRATEQELVAGWTRYYTYDDNDKLTKMGTTSEGNDLATFGYDSNGNMTSVAGNLFGSKTLVYDDENRLTSILYGGVTDLYYYTWEGLRYRARLNGTYQRYVYNDARVLEETNDYGTVLARYTTESGSYYQPLHHMWRSSSISRFPLYDAIGTARMLVDASGTTTDTYHLDAWGEQLGSTGTTVNPYRFGGAWGYITDPSGMLQLGARFYWPEVGRFVQRDAVRSGLNRYWYGSCRPTGEIDPTGAVSAKYRSDRHCTRLWLMFSDATVDGRCDEAGDLLLQLDIDCTDLSEAWAGQVRAGYSMYYVRCNMPRSSLPCPPDEYTPRDYHHDDERGGGQERGGRPCGQCNVMYF